MLRTKYASSTNTALLLSFLASISILPLFSGCKDKVTVKDEQSSCENVDCSGHGFCAEADGQAYCICEAGYHADGLECVEGSTSDDCDGVDCSGHGTCAVSPGGAICVCEAGYHADGLACKENQAGHECDGVDCSGHGQCLVVAGDPNAPLCICDDGYHAVGDTNCVADSSGCFPAIQDPPGMVSTSDSTNFAALAYTKFGDGLWMFTLVPTGQVHEQNGRVMEQELDIRLTPISGDGIVGNTDTVSTVWAAPRDRGASSIPTLTHACSETLLGVSTTYRTYSPDFHSFAYQVQHLYRLDANGQIVGETTTDDLGLEDGYVPRSISGIGNGYMGLGRDGIVFLDCNLNVTDQKELRSAFEDQSDYDVFLVRATWDGAERFAISGLSVEGSGKGIQWHESFLAMLDQAGDMVSQPRQALSDLGDRFIFNAVTSCGPNCFVALLQYEYEGSFWASGPGYLLFLDGEGNETLRSFLPIPLGFLRTLAWTGDMLLLAGLQGDSDRSYVVFPFDMQGSPLATDRSVAKGLDLPTPPTDAEWMSSGGVIPLDGQNFVVGLTPNSGSQAGIPSLTWFGCPTN